MSLHNVHPDKRLHLKSGVVVKNLYDLANELALMDDESFEHHVNGEKNDFHDWIRHVIQDEHLTRIFSQYKDRRLLLGAVERRIGQLEQESKRPFHFTAKDYLLGVIVGAMAMLMMSRLL